jgi:putative ATPase
MTESILTGFGARVVGPDRSQGRPSFFFGRRPDCHYNGTVTLDLFPSSPGEDRPDPGAPLADRMRPRTLENLVGLEDLLGPGRLLARALEAGQLPSTLLWGPPGSGKTTLALLLARTTGADFVALSAVSAGIKDLKEVVKRAGLSLRAGRRTVLFLDEIHRFNKAQQDALLPHVERGTLTLIGATTENPSFEVNAALLSRMTLLTLPALGADTLSLLLDRALADTGVGLGARRQTIDEAARHTLVEGADGDARRLLNALEAASVLVGEGGVIDGEAAREALQNRALRYDKDGEEHYNIISALHKSVRDSDPDGALYWLARMLEAGEDRLYVARRLVRMASEDIGLADPQALVLAMAARDAAHFLGIPEGDLALAQAAVYLAMAPKSNAVYLGYGAATRDATERGSLPVPLHIRNAPTGLMKTLGYGRGYRYAHDYPGHVVDQEHLPEELEGTRYYEPTDQGVEAAWARRLEEIRAMRNAPDPKPKKKSR